MLRGVAGSYRLSPSDVEDAVQTAWLRPVDNIDRAPRVPAARARREPCAAERRSALGEGTASFCSSRG